jgi:hypothetical protein
VPCKRGWSLAEGTFHLLLFPFPRHRRHQSPPHALSTVAASPKRRHGLRRAATHHWAGSSPQLTTPVAPTYRPAGPVVPLNLVVVAPSRVASAARVAPAIAAMKHKRQCNHVVEGCKPAAAPTAAELLWLPRPRGTGENLKMRVIRHSSLPPSPSRPPPPLVPCWICIKYALSSMCINLSISIR